MYRGEWEYDVFVCFRGDTRRGFTSHLKDALSRKQIKTFIDTMLTKTESIDELLSVLKRSAVSVVVFSEKFADSTWCLDEVATIARSMKDFGHRALPVFYRVDPFDDVTGDSGSYSATIDQVLEASPGAGDKKGWMDASKEVAKCAGRTSEEKQIESELIETVVEDVLKILIDMSPTVKSNKLVDMGSRVLQVERLLAMDEVTDTRIIGLWGMGGSGKTTLAETCYQRQTSASRKGPFIKHHFIRNISEKYEGQCGIDGLIQELYAHLLSEDKLTREDLNVGFRRQRLSNLRVFLVLDDVGTSRQLSQLLLGSSFANEDAQLFAPGSRIIVTARDKAAIKYKEVVKTHEVKCLHDNEALQLFSLSAFKCSVPPDDWMDQSRIALSYCSGNPLALTVLGGALCDNMDRSYWQSFLKNLALGRTDVPVIHEILRRSYNKLKLQQQRVFLDVACFLHGMLKSRLIYYTKTRFYDAYSDVEDLISKSLLVSVDGKDGKTIEVHDLLKHMAWQIVNEEPDLKNRSRLENPEDITKLLQTLKGDRATEAMNLNLSKAEDMNLEANTFEGMSSLKWLGFCWPRVRLGWRKFCIPGATISFLPAELRGLKWDNYPSRTLPSGFSPENLRILALRESRIVKCWEGESQAAKLVNLVELDLYSCRNLTALPDLSMSSHLEVLILRDCTSLVELPSYVGYLDKLVRLDVEDCSNLEQIPAKLNSKHLKYVLMSKCWKLTCCPEINSTELEVLDLDRTPINAAPPASIYNQMKQGGTLSLHCPQITTFPPVPARLESLRLSNTSITEIEFRDQHHSSTVAEFDSALDGPRFGRLQLVGNSQLKSLPFNIWKMVSREIMVDGSPLIETLPKISDPLENFTWLAVTNCRLLKQVSSTISNLKSVQVLNFSGTAIKTLPSCIQELGELSTLELSNCSRLESIPDILHKLAKLSVLIVMASKKLTSLPRLPSSLKLLSARFCKSLRALPSDIGRLSCPEMWFDCCSQLDRALLDELVSEFPHQVMPRHSQGTRLYPGTELPGQFRYQSEEEMAFLRVTLPAAANCEQEMKGIAFGVVTTSQRRGVMQQMTCGCYILDNYMDGSRHGSSSSRIGARVASWHSSVLVGFDDDSPSHVHLWFDDNSGQSRTMSEGQEEEEEEEAWYVKYAGATVLIHFYQGGKELKIKRCGVALLY